MPIIIIVMIIVGQPPAICSLFAKLLLANYYLGQSHKHFGMSSRATIIIITILIIVVIVLIRQQAKLEGQRGADGVLGPQSQS